MQFGYECEKCKKRFDVDFPIGKATRTVPCSTCGGLGKRVYEGMCIAVKIDGHTSMSSGFGEQQKKRNLQAAKRMAGRKAPVRLVAHDYGNGDIRGV